MLLEALESPWRDCVHFPHLYRYDPILLSRAIRCSVSWEGEQGGEASMEGLHEVSLATRHYSSTGMYVG